MPEGPAASELPSRTSEYHQQDNRFVVERHAKRVSYRDDRDILISWKLLE